MWPAINKRKHLGFVNLLMSIPIKSAQPPMLLCINIKTFDNIEQTNFRQKEA